MVSKKINIPGHLIDQAIRMRLSRQKRQAFFALHGVVVRFGSFITPTSFFLISYFYSFSERTLTRRRQELGIRLRDSTVPDEVLFSIIRDEMTSSRALFGQKLMKSHLLTRFGIIASTYVLSLTLSRVCLSFFLSFSPSHFVEITGSESREYKRRSTLMVLSSASQED
jgi:hypothetical protein